MAAPNIVNVTSIVGNTSTNLISSTADPLEFNQQLLLRISEKLQQAGIRVASQGTPQNR